MIDSILKIVNKFIPNQEERDKLAVSLEKEVTAQMKLRSNVILKEMNAKKSWRRRFMLLCASIVAINYVLFTIIPYIITMFDLNLWVMQDPGLESWIVEMLKIGLTGYIGSETALYGIEKWRK